MKKRFMEHLKSSYIDNLLCLEIRVEGYPIWIYNYSWRRKGKMIATVSKWGNSLGIRVPSDITAATGISDGDKVEVTSRSDGSIIIRKKKKDAAQLKAFGVLHRYANPELIPLEDKAFGMAMEEKYGKEK